MPDYDVITYTRPDGVSINLSDPPYMLKDYDGFGIGEFDLTTVEPPQGHGSYWYDTRMAAKVLSVTYSYMGEGVVERQASRRDIVRTFNPLLGPGVLRIDQANGISREITCILAESLPLPGSDFVGAGAYDAVVRFKSHGIPAFRDPNINSVPIQGGSRGSSAFPKRFPWRLAQSGVFTTIVVNNDGDTETPIHIWLSGPLLNPIFKNVTTGKTISMNGLSLVRGDNIVIDTAIDSYTVQVNGADAWQYLVESNFWDLVQGRNEILFDIGGTDPVNTAGTMSWYTRYLGQ